MKTDEHYSCAGFDFEWNAAKAAKNLEKHGITFKEAASTWADDSAVSRGDIEHSWEEERTLRIGFSRNANLLLVVHCYRDFGNRVRIVSARKATKEEESIYETIRGMA